MIERQSGPQPSLPPSNPRRHEPPHTALPLPMPPRLRPTLPPQPKTPPVIFTVHDTAEGLKTGLRHTVDFFRGAQVAAAERKFNAQKQRALEEARHQQLHRRQPALAGGHSSGVARPSEAPSSKSTAAIGQPGGKSGVMKMARRSGVNNLPKSPDLSERIKANRNLKTRLDVKPAHSTQVPYGGDNLSQKAIEHRKNWVHPKTGKKGYWKQGNIAVYEYRDGGELRTYAVKSIPRKAGKVGLHSEPAGLLDLEEMGVKLDQITQVYTEREPCMSAGNYCGTLLASELPNIPVTHSFEYGIDPNSQAAGNAALEDALKEVKRTSK